MKIDTNARDVALELIADGIVSAEQMVLMCLKFMSTDDVTEMLDINELSDRFMSDHDEDGDEDED